MPEPSPLQSALPAQVDKMTRDLFSFVTEHGGEGPDVFVTIQGLLMASIITVHADPNQVMRALTKNILQQHADCKKMMQKRQN